MPRVITVEPLGDDAPFPWAPPPGDVRAFAPLLHSARDDRGPWSRWSYTPGPATRVLRGCLPPGKTRLFAGSDTLKEWDDPREALRWLGEQATQRPTDGPPFKGGWTGWLGYDLGRCFESLPARARDDLHLPLFEFTHHDGVLAFDHVERRQYRVRSSEEAAIEGRMLPWVPQPSPLVSNFTREAYVRAVGRAIEYIRAGDIFQVNLSQRFTCGVEATPQEVYRRLVETTPAWFGAYLTGEDYALVCNSPELFLRVIPQADGSQTVVTRPIKGTRPRQSGMQDELLRSAKDQAELNMIIDLERNDLGRVCEIGSVKVTQPRTIEAHPTVYHGVATVEGRLRGDVDFVDLLRATFPGGSITGAPKIRAMEIIEELEPTRRGPYCGAIGYLSADGHMEFNVAIRTMIMKDGLVHVPVGGGIVADSQPADEYEETLVKARAMFGALGLSVDDLRRV
jgi:para-aminobenzoate synthetase component 1